jgi:hypothetical protein
MTAFSFFVFLLCFFFFFFLIKREARETNFARSLSRASLFTLYERIGRSGLPFLRGESSKSTDLCRRLSRLSTFFVSL